MGALGAKVPEAASYIFQVNFFAGLGVSIAVYWGLCKFFPVPATSNVWLEVGEDADSVRVQYDQAKEADDGVSVVGLEIEEREKQQTV